MSDPCNHDKFKGNFDVTKLETDGKLTGNIMADIRIECADCKQPFRFMGTRIGMSFREPMANPTREELRAPIEPSDGSIGNTPGEKLQ